MILALTICKATAKVKEKVKEARKRRYKYYKISFPYNIPILGIPLNSEQAVKTVKSGQSVITYYRSDARYVANVAGGAKAVCDQRHGGEGYFNLW